jgi:hypothetical protein
VIFFFYERAMMCPFLHVGKSPHTEPSLRP